MHLSMEINVWVFFPSRSASNFGQDQNLQQQLFFMGRAVYDAFVNKHSNTLKCLGITEMLTSI